MRVHALLGASGIPWVAPSLEASWVLSVELHKIQRVRLLEPRQVAHLHDEVHYSLDGRRRHLAEFRVCIGYDLADVPFVGDVDRFAARYPLREVPDVGGEVPAYPDPVAQADAV